MTAILGACILLWYTNVASTRGINFLLPKWTQTMSDENMTGIPEYIIKLQNSTFYPTRDFLQNMFSTQFNRYKAEKFQV